MQTNHPKTSDSGVEGPEISRRPAISSPQEPLRSTIATGEVSIYLTIGLSSCLSKTIVRYQAKASTPWGGTTRLQASGGFPASATSPPRLHTHASPPSSPLLPH